MSKPIALMQQRRRSLSHRRVSTNRAADSTRTPQSDPSQERGMTAPCATVAGSEQANLSANSITAGTVTDNTRHQAQPSAMLYLRPPKRMGPVLQLQAFDAVYLEALRIGEPRTQQHFVCYFTELLQLKLRSRLRSPQAIEDVRQETFARVLTTIRRKDGLRQPERLGPFVNTVCNNVLLEHYRQSSRSDSLDDEGAHEPASHAASVHDVVESRQMEAQVREVLSDLPEHDRSLLKAVFIDERDREEVCQEFGVDRDYLRVLLHRAKHVFKAAYLKRSGDRLPFTSAPGEA